MPSRWRCSNVTEVTADLRQLLPVPLDRVNPSDAYAYPEDLRRPWMRVNMVSSLDGAAWGPSGRSGELSSPADRAVLATLRGLCDVVLVGAATARSEGYRPVRPREVWQEQRAGRPATPGIAVVTRSLDVHPDLLAEAPADAPTIVFTTGRAPKDRRRAAAQHAEVIVAGEEAVGPSAVLSALAERGLLRVLCEGGPHLLAELGAADLVDELCLTLSPLAAGPGASRIVAGSAAPAPQEFHLGHVLECKGSLFLRYLR